MTVKLNLPPGFFQNDTEYSGAGRWIGGNLVRWNEGHIEPIGGWQEKVNFATDSPLAPLWTGGFSEGFSQGFSQPSTPGPEAIRNGIALSDLAGGVNLFLGSNKAIYMLSETNVLSLVTPSGFTPQSGNAEILQGYGMFNYGYGLYGTPRPISQSIPTTAFSWGFAEWGEWPIAVAREVAALNLYIKKNTDAVFVEIPASPEGAHDVLVTDERIVMTIGKTTDHRYIQWSDQEDYTNWTKAVDTLAGGRRLSGAGKLLRAIKVLGQILIVGENDAFTGKWVGPPHVYGFQRIGSSCGIAGPQAIAVTNEYAMWLGQETFWKFDGALTPVDCEVMTYFLDNHQKSQRSKIQAFTIADFSEIWWLYQSVDSAYQDVDSYIIYNHKLNKWYTGKINRTFGIDSGIIANVTMVDINGQIYDHEIKSAHHESFVPYIQSGPLEVANGDKLLAIGYVLPDDANRGDIAMELSVREHAQDASPRYTRTFALRDPTSTTGIRGRDIRMKLYGTGENPYWKIGQFRISPPGSGPER